MVWSLDLVKPEMGIFISLKSVSYTFHLTMKFTFSVTNTCVEIHFLELSRLLACEDTLKQPQITLHIKTCFIVFPSKITPQANITFVGT